MPHLKLAVALATALFLVACKIQISVPERGGRVASENIACESGQQCDLIVEAPDFNEVFVAEADPGYEFVGWRRAPAYFCGGTTGSCTISTLLFAGNPTFLGFLTLDFDYFLEPIFACQEDSAGNLAAECGLATETLAGQVVGIDDARALARGEVVVTVNGIDTETSLNSQGQFSLQVDGDGDDLVLVTISLPADGGGQISLASFAGTLAELAAQGGLAVSPVSTARYGLAVLANNGAVPVNSAQLYAAEASTDPGELLDLAAAVSLIIGRNSYSLPDDVDDLLDFVSDRDDFEDFFEEVNQADPSLLASTSAQLATDSFSQASVAARYIAVAPSVAGYLSRFGELVDLSGAGQTGAVSGSLPLGDLFSDSVSWEISGGDLLLTYADATTEGTLFSAAETSATPAQLALLEAEEATAFVQYPYTDTRLDDRFALIDSGQFVAFTSLEQRSNRSFQPVQLTNTTGGTVNLADEVVTTQSGESLRPEDALPQIPFAAECAGSTSSPCVPGTWGGLFLSSPGNDFAGAPLAEGSFADVISFSTDGTATGDISGKSASWSVDSGSLVIDFGDGAIQTVTLIQQVGFEYGALVEYSINGEQFADYNVYVKRDESLVINASLVTNPDGSYWANDLSAYAPGVIFDTDGSRDPASTFGFSFYNDAGEQTGFNEFVRLVDDELTLTRNPLTWTLEPDRVNFNRNPGTDRARYFYPLAADVSDEGRRLFGVEYEVRNDVAPNVVNIPPRTTIYAEVPLPALD